MSLSAVPVPPNSADSGKFTVYQFIIKKLFSLHYRNEMLYMWWSQWVTTDHLSSLIFITNYMFLIGNHMIWVHPQFNITVCLRIADDGSQAGKLWLSVYLL